jgi:hypothetical protein
MVAARALWLETHPLPTDLHHLSVDVKDSPATVRADQTKVNSAGPAGVRRASHKKNSVREKTSHGVASGVGS